MKKNHEQISQEVESSKNPLGLFCAAISNITSWARGNQELKLWPKFSLASLASCFTDIDQNLEKENFLTEKPLAARLQMIDNEGDVRRVIPEGVRISLVVNPCLEEGLLIPSKYLNDQTNRVFPYFKLLFSNPSDVQGNALGMGNIKPAPFLHLYPEEILTQCSFVVEYPQDDDDYLYLAAEITDRYQRLQELVKGRLK